MFAAFKTLLGAVGGPAAFPILMTPGSWSRTVSPNFSLSVGYGYSGPNTQTKAASVDTNELWLMPGFVLGRLTQDYTQNETTGVFSVRRLHLEIVGPSVPEDAGWTQLSITPAGGATRNFNRSSASSSAAITNGRRWYWNISTYPIPNTTLVHTIVFS